MSKKLYIAYGSNLNLKQMKYRCPTAKLIGKGVVENYGLQFKGMPHCSYATIAPCIGKSVPVALWELQPRDEKLLDRYEGYPSHYFKQDFGLPSASYYDTVSQGYKDCGFDMKVLNEAVNDSAEKFYENLEQNNLFDSPDEDEVEDFTNEIGGMSL